jgi:hypothetical protein
LGRCGVARNFCHTTTADHISLLIIEANHQTVVARTCHAAHFRQIVELSLSLGSIQIRNRSTITIDAHRCLSIRAKKVDFLTDDITEPIKAHRHLVLTAAKIFVYIDIGVNLLLEKRDLLQIH